MNIKFSHFIVAGGTGGHVIPALALAEQLTKNNGNCNFIVDQRGIKFLNHCTFKVTKIKLLNLTTPFWKLCSSLYLLFIAFIKLLWLFSQNRNAKILIFGGYSCLPALMAAIILRMEIIVHEQNAVMGRVNRIASYFASKIFLTFSNSLAVPTKVSNKIFVTGCPLRAQFAQHDFTYKNHKKSLKILIIGGSQGSKLFSDSIPQIIGKLDKKIAQEITVTQQVKTFKDVIEIGKIYNNLSIDHQLELYFNNMNELMDEADIIISRAGASTINEIITSKRPAILIPLSNSKDNHQFYNAKFLADKQAAILITEENIERDLLSQLIELSNFKLREDIHKKLGLMPNDAIQKIIELL